MCYSSRVSLAHSTFQRFIYFLMNLFALESIHDFLESQNLQSGAEGVWCEMRFSGSLVVSDRAIV